MRRVEISQDSEGGRCRETPVKYHQTPGSDRAIVVDRLERKVYLEGCVTIVMTTVSFRNDNSDAVIYAGIVGEQSVNTLSVSSSHIVTWFRVQFVRRVDTSA